MEKLLAKDYLTCFRILPAYICNVTHLSALIVNRDDRKGWLRKKFLPEGDDERIFLRRVHINPVKERWNLLKRKNLFLNVEAAFRGVRRFEKFDAEKYLQIKEIDEFVEEVEKNKVNLVKCVDVINKSFVRG